MKLYIDSADIQQIRTLTDYYPIAGVTTNPTILVNEGRPFLRIIKDIRALIGDEKELFVQVVGSSAEEILQEVQCIQRHLSGNVVPKVPVTEEGIKAIRLLSEEGTPVLATTIYTPFQALMAAMAGATYVAPYVNRIDNLTGSGRKVVEEIVHLFASYKLPTQIIAASFKNLQQVYDVCLAGAQSVTVGPDLIEKMIAFPATSSDVATFKKQWKAQYGRETLLPGNEVHAQT